MTVTVKESTLDWVRTNVPQIEARDYQIEVWDALKKRRAKGRKRALVHLATGLGKTSVAAVDVMYYLKEENPNGRVLFVSHMSDISVQAERSFKFIYPELTTHILQGNRHSKGRIQDVDVTFSTFQTLHTKLNTAPADYYSYIIFDEAHHIEADTFSAVRHHFKPEFTLALTATPERADGRDIFNYFGHPIYEKSLAEGIADGWLSPVDYRIVFDDALKEAMDNGFETKNRQDIRDLFSIKSRNDVVAKEIVQRRHEIGLDKAKTIVFCQNITAATEMAALLGGEVYHSEVSLPDREKLMRRFKLGHLQVICTVDMFNEGIDIPDARVVVFLRSTSSRTIFEQQLGRGLRKAPGKDKVTIIDFVANIERFNFVKELGRIVSATARKRSGGGETRGYAGGTLPAALPFDVTSTFEFDEKVIELLRRYEEMKTEIPDLSPEFVYDIWMRLGQNTKATAAHLKIAVVTAQRYIRMHKDYVPKTYTSLEEIVALYNDGVGVQQIADNLGISWQAVKKRLVKAGVYKAPPQTVVIDPEEVIKIYKKVGSLAKVAAHYNMSAYPIRRILIENGVTIEKPTAPKKASPELIAAFEKFGSVRAAAEYLGVGRHAARKHLINSGIDVSRKPSVYPTLSEGLLERLYERHNGSIADMVWDDELVKIKETLPKNYRSRFGWIGMYQALDKFGYLSRRPITPAIAAAAYYKYGTSTKAGEALGVSGALISRKSKEAAYLKKYKEKV